MSVEQIEATIESMSMSERQKLARWFDEHRHVLLPEIETAQQAEVLTRLAETDAHPELLEPFAEADVERMFKEFADARLHKTSGKGWPGARPSSAAAMDLRPAVFSISNGSMV
jgi:hypothetical protein